MLEKHGAGEVHQVQQVEVARELEEVHEVVLVEVCGRGDCPVVVSQILMFVVATSASTLHPWVGRTSSS